MIKLSKVMVTNDARETPVPGTHALMYHRSIIHVLTTDALQLLPL